MPALGQYRAAVQTMPGQCRARMFCQHRADLVYSIGPAPGQCWHVCGVIEDVINRNNLLLYNNKAYTYLHPGMGTYSAIDLTLADASIFLDYSWKVHDDTCGSDHFPIILENSGPKLDDKIPRWNLRRAKWDEFKNSCILKLNSDTNNTDDDNITYFSKTLISIAEESIPKTSSNK